MKSSIIIVLSAIILTAGCASSGGPRAGAPASAGTTQDEAALAALLRGRIAGPPQNCVGQYGLGGNRSYGIGVIVFGDPTSQVIYVNRPPVGCPSLGFGRALQTRTTTGQLCRGDIVTVFDPVSGMDYGSCSLGEFTPYERAR